MHGLMIANGMPRFYPTPACKIKESLIELKRVTISKTGELEESYIPSDFYLSREFTDGELRLLIDSLLFSRHIPYSRLREQVKKHVYMYSGGNCWAVFRVCRAMIGDVIELFGTEVTFSDEDDAGVTVTAFTNEMTMEQFALNFAPDVTVLEPKNLRENVKKQLVQALEKYQ